MDSLEQRLEKFKQHLKNHPDFNNLEFPNLDDEFTTIKNKIHCFCKIHKHDFYVYGNNLIKGNRCPKCASESRKQKLHKLSGINSPIKISYEEAILRAKAIHGNRYDYSSISEEKWAGVCGKYEIACNKHGKFIVDFSAHIGKRMYGCPECGKESIRKSLSKGKQHFIDKANLIHNNYYDYSKLPENVNSSSKVTIICPEHGEFVQLLSNHCNGQKCPKCAKKEGGSKLAEQLLYPNSFYIEKAKSIHGDLYDYSLIDPNEKIGCDVKVPIICKEHGVFYQKWSNHCNKRDKCGCPICNNSKMELMLSEKLKSLNVRFEREKEFPGLVGVFGKPLRFDFYLPDNNVCIECDGPQHHQYIPGLHKDIKSFERQLEHDKRKEEFCKKNGITLKRLTINDF